MSFDFTPTTIDDIEPERRPSFGLALVPVLAVVAFLGVGSAVLGLDPHVPLLWSIVSVGAFGRYLGYDWPDLFDGISNGLLMGLQALLIIFTIYALIATWVSAGTIPAMMYYGLELLTPTIFLPVTAILGAVVAFSIGSSWTTVGTLGVAFVGIGAGLGVPAPMTVGAVISGAYAGDKQSPLSDTTNLAAGVTNTPLYDHIRRMRTGTAIAFGLAVAGFAVLGLRAGGEIPVDRVVEIQTALGGRTTSRCSSSCRWSSPSGWLSTAIPPFRRSSPAFSPASSPRSWSREPASSPPGRSSCTGLRPRPGPTS